MINVEQYRAYCIAKAGVTEGFPFDEKVLVFKVCNKMFALADIDSFEGVNLKCDPEKALELRATYDGIRGGYHMSKKHWNTVAVDGSVPAELFFHLIDHSYDLIVSKLTKKEKDGLRATERK